MPKGSGWRPTLLSLWFRLSTLAIIAFVFAEALFLGRTRIQGWSFYLAPSEVIFEVAVRLLFGALAGIALATLSTALLVPFVWYFASWREALVEWLTNAAVVLVIFLDSRLALTSLIEWSNRGVRFTSALLVMHFLFFVFALCIPRLRREVVTSLDAFLGEKMTRVIAWTTVIITIALAATEFAFAQSRHTVKAATASQHPKSNILLITFDALSAEDMSLYGYKLPTTPNIDVFARNATVFTNFYSTSTFTTPCIATILTGDYLSESRVYQLQGKLPANDASKNLPQLMSAAGYATGAFLSNPFAYYFASNPGNGFDVLPEPTFQEGGLQTLWSLTSPLHQDSGIGSRVTEYIDLEGLWSSLTRVPGNLAMRYRPNASFEQTSHVLAQLPDGFFMWVHVITPHHPYLPDPADRGRFLPDREARRFEEESELQWQPHYEPDQQNQVDRRRLLYDEFLLTADRAFGSFMTELEKSGRLQNTTVILSADHGESFEGGVFRHESPYLTRPDIHIPLIIKTPGQQQQHRIFFTADQTVLAPTILELAGLAKPDWMRGQSLATWLTRDNAGTGEGVAFSQFFEKNSVFRPLRHGLVAAIDGQYEYVVNLDTLKGALRPLNQAQIWDLDRTEENPARADRLRAAICRRFPGLNPQSK